MKKFIKKCLGKLGYELHIKQYPRGWEKNYLSSLSSASVIIDAGAAYGTPDLYAAFDDRKILMIEPLEEYQGSLETWRETLDCRIVYTAVGAEEGDIEIEIDPERRTRSSVKKRSDFSKTAAAGQLRRVPITTIDKLVAENYNNKDSFAIKIDVEGFELEVLKGSINTLSRTDLIIVETPVAWLYENQTDYFQLINFMLEKKFRLFDVLHLAYYKDWQGLMWMDLAFVPTDRKFSYKE